MHPPHILQEDAELFVSGSGERYKDVPDDVRKRIVAWTVQDMGDSRFPLQAVYPDLALPADRLA